MSHRRNRPINRFGCKPSEDVCVEHDMPLECRHGCQYANEHKCKDKDSAYICMNLTQENKYEILFNSRDY